ncbi:Arb2 domain-containing protein [Aspergillus pseudoustus]|uniref:Arb2 domain-containing protein n=1 Tax=Aspergillus pseudoustus TaxID=1810923 RepID=A0ABR4ILS3_9EURO
MFVYRKQDLPQDPVFPAELDKLGYFINDKDQIRKISDPEQEFQFKINKNPRWNEVQREAMNECIRRIVSTRLRDLGLVTLQLLLTSSPIKPRVPVLVSKNLKTARRIIVVFGEPVQDLGIWAYRTVGAESINAGSAVDFAKAVLKPSENGKGEVALVLANMGQLIWHCTSGRAMTVHSWMAQPRPSAVESAPSETKRNKIRGNENWEAHVSSVFDGILAARGKLVREDAKIDIIGLAEGGLGAIRYLSLNWKTWRHHISAICLSNPLHTKAANLIPQCDQPTGADSLAAFVASRCRAYLLSGEPLGIPLFDSPEHGCNCYSSGEGLNVECIMPKAWPHMLEWLDRAYADPGYCEDQPEVVQVISEVAESEGGGKEQD